MTGTGLAPFGATAPTVAADRSVLGRAFAVLRTFDDRHRSRTASEVARAVGLPVPTVHRLCVKLTELGALDRDASGRFSVGTAMWEMGNLAPRRHDLREVALPYMEDLYVATRENVQLTVLDGTDALYVEQLTGRESVPVVSRSGGRLPAHVSSGGLVLLAHSPAPVVRSVLETGLPPYTPQSITDEATLRRMLHEIRRRGHVVCRQMADPHSVALAAPLTDRTGVVAALGLVVDPATAVGPLIPALTATARAVSRTLTT